ncbi:MAG: lasso peptide biosynthesis PqqD family chaperone [Candidatus Riflebacteria bacterium]|nr:lasso peptide biosynthesis PqqD family chaperone [Candidatus Riflebacteria bacterium]
MKIKGISLENLVSKHPKTVENNIDGSTIMMSVDEGKYFGLDTIGSYVWSLIQEPIRVSSLIEGLLQKYEVDRETCEKDVLVFLEELNKDGILKVDNRPE